MIPKRVNRYLVEAWGKGDDFTVTTLFQLLNPLDHLYLLNYEWTWPEIRLEFKPRMLSIFLTACEIQRIESTSFEEIASICSKQLSNDHKIKEYAKNLKYLCRARIRDNMHFCQSSIVAFLGCCQKRRVYQGGLRDVSMFIVKWMWATRRRDAWGK